MKKYSVYVTPICDGGSKLMADADLVRFAVVDDGGTTAFGRSFGSWAKFRMELLRANVLSPAYLTHAEDNFYRGESWQSPDIARHSRNQNTSLSFQLSAVGNQL
jgi:hypothetical protein